MTKYHLYDNKCNYVIFLDFISSNQSSQIMHHLLLYSRNKFDHHIVHVSHLQVELELISGTQFLVSRNYYPFFFSTETICSWKCYNGKIISNMASK